MQLESRRRDGVGLEQRESMRALVVTEYGDANRLQVSEVPIPRPGPGEISIDVAYAGVNYAEIMARAGRHPSFVPPFTPGLEVSGRIRDIGPGVDGLELGQAVCALTSRGGYAEVATVPAALAMPLTEADDLLTMAAIPTVVPSAWSLVRHVGRLQAGESVLVHAAAGGVGSIAGQVARLSDAGPVYGVVSTQAKADYAKQFGYDEVFVGDDWDAQVRRTSPDGVDLIVDSVGGRTRERSFEVLAPLGRLTIYGNASAESEGGIDGSRMRATCRGVLGFSILSLAAIAPQRVRALTVPALAAVRSGDLRIDVTEVFSLGEAAKAHESIESRRSTGKIVLRVQAN